MIFMDFLIGKNKNYKSMIIARVLNHSTMSVRRVNSILFFGGKITVFTFFWWDHLFFSVWLIKRKKRATNCICPKITEKHYNVTTRRSVSPFYDLRFIFCSSKYFYQKIITKKRWVSRGLLLRSRNITYI